MHPRSMDLGNTGLAKVGYTADDLGNCGSAGYDGADKVEDAGEETWELAVEHSTEDDEQEWNLGMLLVMPR